MQGLPTAMVLSSLRWSAGPETPKQLLQREDRLLHALAPVHLSRTPLITTTNKTAKKLATQYHRHAENKLMRWLLLTINTLVGVGWAGVGGLQQGNKKTYIWHVYICIYLYI